MEFWFKTNFKILNIFFFEIFMLFLSSWGYLVINKLIELDVYVTLQKNNLYHMLHQ